MDEIASRVDSLEEVTRAADARTIIKTHRLEPLIELDNASENLKAAEKAAKWSRTR